MSFKLRTWLRRLWSSCQSLIAYLCDCSPRGRGGFKASTAWCKVQIPHIRETRQRHSKNSSIYYQRALKQLQSRRVLYLSSAASFPVQMESVNVSIVNYFMSISYQQASVHQLASDSRYYQVCAARVTNLSPRLIFESSCSYSVSCVIVKCFTGHVKWPRELTNFESYPNVRLCMTGSCEICQSWRRLIETNWSRVV